MLDDRPTAIILQNWMSYTFPTAKDIPRKERRYEYTYHAQPVLGEAYAIGTYWCLVHKAVYLRSLRHPRNQEPGERFTETLYWRKKERFHGGKHSASLLRRTHKAEVGN